MWHHLALLRKAGLSTGSFADRFRPGSVYL